jgi:protein SCO1/2
MQQMAVKIFPGALLALTMLAGTSQVQGHHVDDSNERLVKMGPAADFDLTAQNGTQFSIKDVTGKVVAVSFTYTGCIDTCPLLTAKMVTIQKKLGREFGTDIFFVTVSMDPEVDRPEILERYARALGCDLGGWVFLTGTEVEIEQVARDYGVFRKKLADGNVDHTLMTTIIDRSGIVRVQYIGMRFDVDEFLHDLKELVHEESPA